MYVKEEEILKNPLKIYKKLAIPLIILEVFDAVFMLIDTFWGSLIDVESIIAIGISAPILILIIKFGITLGQGTNSYMSRSFGENNVEKAKNTFLHGIIIAIIVSIIIPLFTIPFLKEILGFFDYYDSITQISYYIIPILICSFIFILKGLFAETIQSEGDSKRPAAYTIMGNILNLVLSPILAFYCGLGIFGLSLGTIIGYSFPLIIFLYIYYNKDNLSAKLSFKTFNIDLKIFKEIFKVTLPNFVERSFFTFLTIYVNIILITFVNPAFVALYTLCMAINDLIQSPTRGGARGLLTVTGHLYGANEIYKIKKLCNSGLKIGIILSIISSVIFFCFQGLIFGYMDSEIYDMTQPMLICLIMIILNLLVPTVFIFSKIFDGLGRSIYSLIGSLIYVISCVILISIFVFIENYYGWSVPLGIVVAEIITVFYYIIIMKMVLNKLDEKSV